MPVQSSNLPQAVKCFTWRRQSDGAIILPYWRMEQLQSGDENFPTRLRITLPDGFKVNTVVLHSMDEQQPRAIGYEAAGNELQVPVLVKRRASWLEIR